jgi:hypothetical protein
LNGIDRSFRWPNFDVEHECVNWETLNGWAIENSFDMFKPNLLIHPELGMRLPKTRKKLMALGLSFPMIDGKIQLSALSNKTVFVYPEQDMHDHSAHKVGSHP